jgi:hypothetical protein
LALRQHIVISSLEIAMDDRTLYATILGLPHHYVAHLSCYFRSYSSGLGCYLYVNCADAAIKCAQGSLTADDQSLLSMRSARLPDLATLVMHYTFENLVLTVFVPRGNLSSKVKHARFWAASLNSECVLGGDEGVAAH